MNRLQTVISSVALSRRIFDNAIVNWLRNSFIPAIKGLKAVFREERNFRIEIIFGLTALVLGAFLSIDITEWAALIICIGIVLVTETINSAIERTGDSINPGYDPLIGRLKDISAGAVLIASLTALITGLIIFIPAIMNAI